MCVPYILLKGRSLVGGEGSKRPSCRTEKGRREALSANLKRGMI